MSEKNSIAQKKRWSEIKQGERSDRMSKLVSRRHSKMSKKDKRDHALKMVEARKKKAEMV